METCRLPTIVYITAAIKAAADTCGRLDRSMFERDLVKDIKKKLKSIDKKDKNGNDQANTLSVSRKCMIFIAGSSRKLHESDKQFINQAIRNLPIRLFD
jgi:hypothetical protein